MSALLAKREIRNGVKGTYRAPAVTFPGALYSTSVQGETVEALEREGWSPVLTNGPAGFATGYILMQRGTEHAIVAIDGRWKGDVTA